MEARLELDLWLWEVSLRLCLVGAHEKFSCGVYAECLWLRSDQRGLRRGPRPGTEL